MIHLYTDTYCVSATGTLEELAVRLAAELDHVLDELAIRNTADWPAPDQAPRLMAVPA